MTKKDPSTMNHPGAALAAVTGMKVSEFGPHMRGLTDRQRAFVLAVLESGKHNFTEAAAAAGYSSKSYNSLRVCASNLAHDSRIQSAMQEEARRRIHSSSIMAVSTLIEIANDDTAKAGDRLKAAGMLMDRCGLHATTEHKMTVENVSRNDREELEKIKATLVARGIDPMPLLKGFNLVIDAEAVEVIDGSEGIEDLI